MAEISANIAKKHKIDIVYGECFHVTAVSNVLSCDENVIVLKLFNNVLTLKGEKFNITNLNLEGGEVFVDGVIGMLSYSKTREKTSLIKKVFK